MSPPDWKPKFPWWHARVDIPTYGLVFAAVWQDELEGQNIMVGSHVVHDLVDSILQDRQRHPVQIEEKLELPMSGSVFNLVTDLTKVTR